jgi:hypothetical protein
MKTFEKIYIVIAIVVTLVALVMTLDSIVGWYMGLPKGIIVKTSGVEKYPIGNHFLVVMYFYFIWMWVKEINKKFRKN